MAKYEKLLLFEGRYIRIFMYGMLGRGSDMETLKWLGKWYADMCDGSWEKEHGILINTLDNPGWYMLIDVVDTPFANKQFETIDVYNSENDWIHCCIRDGKFDGAGDTTKLSAIIDVFRKWNEFEKSNMDVLEWLQKWYADVCDGSWEHMYGVKIETIENQTWLVLIDIIDTPFMSVKFEEFAKRNGADDWISCRVEGEQFVGEGDLYKLEDILNVFRRMVEMFDYRT